jgi:hypothetical protein
MADKDANAELEALVGECRDEAVKAHRRGRAYYRSSYAVMMVSVLASIAAGVGVLALEQYQKVFGVVALVPALCALAAGQLKLVEKTGWFYRRQREMNALARRVTVARKRSPDVDTLEKCVALLNEVERGSDEEWARTAAFSFTASLQEGGGRGSGTDD